MSAGPTKKPKQEAQHSVLVLGAGLVAGPLVRYLAENDIAVTLASRTVSKAEKMAMGLPHVTAVAFDIEAGDALNRLDELVRSCDLVVSMLPYVHHVKAAEIALRHRKHFCTTSYVSDAMQALHERAEEAGVILLNECGVDPGLDHMSAKKVIDDVHRMGGKVRSFYSICGGLPAPSANNNPLGYKLSWSPRGVLLAGRNNARFLRDGCEIVIQGVDLYAEGAYKLERINDDIGTLEWYPNRDSVQYRDIYHIPEAQTLIRGTYRNLGWCRFMRKMAQFGFTSTDENRSLPGKSYAQFTASVIGLLSEASPSILRRHAASKLDEPVDGPVVQKMEWLQLFSDDLKVPPRVTTALDAMCFLFERSLQYEPHEKDMICMKHVFEVDFPSGHRETITSVLIDFGMQPEGASSMARTVSLPVACAARAILEGRIKLTGVVRPVLPAVYNLILEEMSTLGVKFVESVLPAHIWLRAEVKPGELRVPVTPEGAQQLLNSGITVSVERSATRCISDDKYENVGCQLVEAGSWVAAPHAAIIAGIKELPDRPASLHHRHVYFAHCYKGQQGWQDILRRFKQGGGALLDMEFLHDDKNRRVAAFGRPAGMVGMAIGLMLWAAQKRGESLQTLEPWRSADEMVQAARSNLDAAKQTLGRGPSVIVIGALGRCGGGAVWTAEQCGVSVTQWDLPETKSGGPFPQLLEYDIIVNTIYLMDKIPPFFVPEYLRRMERQTSVLVDVSCDATNPNNPFPIYHQITTLQHPVLRVTDSSVRTPFDVVAIDHLPTLLPLESSCVFSNDIVPHLMDLCKPEQSAVWQRALALFHQKAASV